MHVKIESKRLLPTKYYVIIDIIEGDQILIGVIKHVDTFS